MSCFSHNQQLLLMRVLEVSQLRIIVEKYYVDTSKDVYTLKEIEIKKIM